MTCGIGPVTAGILLSVTLILAFACSNNIVDARPVGELEPESLSSSTTQATTSTTSTEFAIGATVEQVSSNGSPEVTTPEEEPEAEEEEPMDRSKVSLDIPDALFAASANLTLRLRDVFGEFIMVSSSSWDREENGSERMTLVVKRFCGVDFWSCFVASEFDLFVISVVS